MTISEGDAVLLLADVGDPRIPTGSVGIIIDVFEAESGFCSYEVMFGKERGWFKDIELGVVANEKSG